MVWDFVQRRRVWVCDSERLVLIKHAWACGLWAMHEVHGSCSKASVSAEMEQVACTLALVGC